MSLKNLLSKQIIVVSTIVSSVMVADHFNSITLPADAKESCIVSEDEFKKWFELGIPEPDGVVKPANSITFPDVPNCSFYKWTEQMFLWLTSPTPPKYGGGGGRIFNSEKFFDVSPPDASGNRVFIPHRSGTLKVFNMRIAKRGPHNLPVVLERNTGRVLEVEKPTLSAGGRQLVLDAGNKPVEIENIRVDVNKRPVFLNRNGIAITAPKPILRQGLDTGRTVQKFSFNNQVFFIGSSGKVIDVEQGQAGGGEVLMAQNGSLVYYSTTVNEVYAYFRTSLGTNTIPATTKFPTTQAQLNAITGFAASHGKTIIDPEALAIEIKTSWIEAAGLPESEKFIKLRGTIPTYDKSNPNKWIVNGQKTVELAMVGMHVVGSTKGHPEMLWGTFEHVNNAPNAAYSYTTTGNTTKTVPQSTAGNWLFCANNASSHFNEAHMEVSGDGIKSTQDLSGKDFGITPSNTIRWKAWGLGEASAVSNTEVISINNSVRKQLKDGDVRKNYIQTGTTWTIFGQTPDGTNEVGTNRLANTTMETYQQGTSNSNSKFNGSNCFTCHSTNTTVVSHIFEPLKPLF